MEEGVRGGRGGGVLGRVWGHFPILQIGSPLVLCGYILEQCSYFGSG